MTINDEQADELFRAELSRAVEGWSAPPRPAAEASGAGARGWLPPGRRPRPEPAALFAAAFAALFLLAVGAGAWSLASGHGPLRGEIAAIFSRGSHGAASPSAGVSASSGDLCPIKTGGEGTAESVPCPVPAACPTVATPAARITPAAGPGVGVGVGCGNPCPGEGSCPSPCPTSQTCPPPCPAAGCPRPCSGCSPGPCPRASTCPPPCSASHPCPTPCAACPSPCGQATSTGPTSTGPTSTGPTSTGPCPAPPPSCAPSQATPGSCPTACPSSACPPPPSPGPTTGTACAPSQVDVAVTTDAGSYPPATNVHITATVHNHSGAACDVPAAGQTYGCTPSADVTNSAGQVVWYSRDPRIMSPCSMQMVGLAPGQSVSQTFTWNQQVTCYGGTSGPSPCVAGQAPPGTYTAEVTWVAHGSRQLSLT